MLLGGDGEEERELHPTRMSGRVGVCVCLYVLRPTDMLLYICMSLFVIKHFWLLQCLVTLGVVGRMNEQEGGTGTPSPRVLVQTKTNRPLVSPDTYSGDRNWTYWVEHFEVVALVNGWDEPTKLLWLPVRQPLGGGWCQR